MLPSIEEKNQQITLLTADINECTVNTNPIFAPYEQLIIPSMQNLETLLTQNGAKISGKHFPFAIIHLSNHSSSRHFRFEASTQLIVINIFFVKLPLFQRHPSQTKIVYFDYLASLLEIKRQPMKFAFE